METISPREAYQKMQAGSARVIDIREPSEIEECTLVGCEMYPLSLLRKGQTIPEFSEETLVITCRSGRRVSMNEALLAGKTGRSFLSLEGGSLAWEKEGLPVKKGPYSLERQVRIGAGSLVLAGILLSQVHPGFLLLSAFVGAGLIFAGITGNCALGTVLAKMPWNKKNE